MTGAGVLAAYRYQPNLERRHHLLKTVQDAAPVLRGCAAPTARPDPSRSSLTSPGASSAGRPLLPSLACCMACS